MTTKFAPQLSLHLINLSAEDPGNWSHLLNLAKACDVAGIDRVMVSDHVVFGEELDEYGKPEVGGRVGGKQPTGPDGHWLEPMTTLAVIAGMTTRVRLGTQILLAALRRPVTLAKSAATLDVLSGGRLDLGVGVGWQKAEYDAAGLDFDKRGRLLDHSLEVCQTLWREKRASYSSPELTFDGIHQMPKPVKPGGVPLWISGTIRESTVRRLVKFGTGWIPWGKDDGDMAESIPKMKEAVAKAGGDADSLQASGPMPVVRGDNGQVDLARTMDRVPARVAAGQTDFAYPFYAPPGADPADTEAKLREIVTAFRGTVGRSAE
jgi:probable F420-dependent oxidoreductase